MMKKKLYVIPALREIGIDLNHEILAVSGNDSQAPNNLSADNWEKGNTDWFGTEKQESGSLNENSIWK